MISCMENAQRCTGYVWCDRDWGYGKAVQSGDVVREDADFGSRVHRELQFLKIREDVMLMEVWDNESADNSSGCVAEYKMQGDIMQNF